MAEEPTSKVDVSDHRVISAILDALEAQSRSNLALVDELTQSRVIQQHMANTLVEIHTGQQQIVERMDKMVERTNDVSRRQADSDSKIVVLESKLVRHVEETNRRLQHLEGKRP